MSVRVFTANTLMHLSSLGGLLTPGETEMPCEGNKDAQGCAYCIKVTSETAILLFK